jgi:hypothetical protein
MPEKPAFLFYGSSQRFAVIRPSEAYDWGYAEGCSNAVYATSNREIVLAFSLGAIPDDTGKYERLMDKKYGHEIKMIFCRGHPNFGGKGYLYKVSSEGFSYAGGTQWVNPSPVTPMEVTEIKVDDYLYLFRYATEVEKQQIEEEFKESQNHDNTISNNR